MAPDLLLIGTFVFHYLLIIPKEKLMNTASGKTIYRWMRIFHRDIGFFVIGLTVIYCISGVMLTYRDSDFLRSETIIEKSLTPSLTSKQLFEELRERKLKVLEENEKEILFTNGSYNKDSGFTSYVKNEIPSVLKALNKLHITPSKEPKHLFTILYATALLFLAISSFWMYKPESKLFKRGVLTSILGAFVSILLVAI